MNYIFENKKELNEWVRRCTAYIIKGVMSARSKSHHSNSCIKCWCSFTTSAELSLDAQRKFEGEVWESTTLNNEIFINIDLMIWY